MTKTKGRVKWFNPQKGFGFIEIENGNDIFVHGSQVRESLQEGDEVQFVIKDSKKGFVATDVEKLGLPNSKRNKRPA